MQNQIDKASALVDAAKKAGADAADAVIVHATTLSVTARLRKIETTNSAETDKFTLRVFVDGRLASVSANVNTNPHILAKRAVEMAKQSPINPYEGLIDKTLLVKQQKNLDLFDNFIPDAKLLGEEALKTEAAALDVLGVKNSGGASTSYGNAGLALVTSNGFLGSYKTSCFTRSCNAIAGNGTKMESDYDYTTALHYEDVEKAEDIGKNAGKNAVRRLNARKAKTGNVDVVFSPRMARGIISHIAAMVNGAAVARKTSLLQNLMGKQIMGSNIQILDNPLILRGQASQPFDDEGMEGHALNIVENGVLKNWLLSYATGRELGLTSNGHGMRVASSVRPSSTNFSLEPSDINPKDLIKNCHTGFYVTNLFGHGVDLVTGQYSRGACGFWIEKGEITYPVSEVTLGSDLLHMLAHLTPANDIDRRYSISSPTILIEGMTLAGK